ncbi:MAG TPA: hypothetical protein VKC99_01255, partial [Methyloceanibacter sp.]|nr:hypothetical protein [Methyloceanibacter sp.]
SIYIGSAPRLAEDVVRSRRLPSRRAREKNALLAPNHAQRLGAFLLCIVFLWEVRPALLPKPAANPGLTFVLRVLSRFL